jgi:hypothetical protein
VLAVVVVLVGSYYVLGLVGVTGSGAAFAAPAVAALVAVWLVWRADHTDEPLPEPVGRGRLTGRVLMLAALVYLSEALVAGLVAGFVPVPADGSAEHSVAVGLRLATTVALPVTLILVYRVGILAAKWLTLRRPLAWLGVVAVVPTLVTLALHPLAAAFADNFGTTPQRDLLDKLPRSVPVTLLVFCALALGHLSRRRAAEDAAVPV